MDKFPILSLQNGRLLSNVKMLPDVLRQPGRSNKADALEAAESIEILIGMVERMKQALVEDRIDFDTLKPAGALTNYRATRVSKLLQELGLE